MWRALFFPGLSSAEVAFARPSSLPPVERELARAVPRDAASWPQRPNPSSLEALCHWPAHKAWIVRVDEGGDEQGPDFDVWLAYEGPEGTVQLRRKAGFDGYHWAVGSPDHMAWWTSTIRPGGTTTVLVGPGASRRRGWLFYGETEARVHVDGELKWAADREGGTS